MLIYLASCGDRTVCWRPLWCLTLAAAASRYISPEGLPVDITFVADHGGFRPSGAVLPVAPPLPYRRTQNFVH